MTTFLLALCIVLLAFAGLSLGVFFGRAPIKGSCGGLACIPGADCAACPNHSERGDKA
ncbi:MAG: (Na+)-NQR maturation NqrM [Paracoccaceae bacterium]|jgi:hypothetical protein